MTQEQIEKAAENIAQKLYDYVKREREPEYSRYDEGYLNAIELQGSFLVKEGIEWALQNQWTDAEKELPNKDGIYLVLVNSKMPLITTFNHIKRTFEPYRPYNITYWMEIPKLNKD